MQTTSLFGHDELNNAEMVLMYLEENPRLLLDDRVLPIIRECKRIIKKYPNAGQYSENIILKTDKGDFDLGNLNEPWSLERRDKHFPLEPDLLKRIFMIKESLDVIDDLDGKETYLKSEIENELIPLTKRDRAIAVYNCLEKNKDFWLTENGLRVFQRCRDVIISGKD